MSDAPAPRFFFAAMSPYSWLAAERLEQVLPQARWHGVYAAAVFKAHGRTSWGLTADRAAGIADCEARATKYGLGPIRWPDPWPTSDLPVARAMTFAAADSEARLKAFGLAAMRHAFLDGANLEELDAVLESGRRAGIEPHRLAEALGEPRVKDGLRGVTGEALAAGVFGVPTVVVGDELFWGDDRLEDAAAAFRGDDRPASDGDRSTR